MADLLEIEGANRFRVRAYRNGARTVAEHPRHMSDLVATGDDLTALPGIGKELAAKIQEMVETGRLSKLEEVKQRTPGSLLQLLKIEGLGPKRVQALYEDLHITNLDELEVAAKQGRVRELHGFGAKTEEKILADLAQAREAEARTRLDVAESLIEPLVDYLRALNGVTRVEVAGSYRRRKETVGDIDVLAIGEDGVAIIQHFVEHEDVNTVVSQGETRSTVFLRSGLQVDLRVVPQESYGAALQYFTGSKAHNVALRTRAVKQGYKINEYGVFQDDERVAGETEAEIYGLLDLAYIEPELREDRGELQGRQSGPAAPAAHRRRYPRRSADAHHRQRRQGVAGRDGPRGPGAGLRVHRHHRSLRLSGHGPGPGCRRAGPPDRRHRRAERPSGGRPRAQKH